MSLLRMFYFIRPSLQCRDRYSVQFRNVCAAECRSVGGGYAKFKNFPGAIINTARDSTLGRESGHADRSSRKLTLPCNLVPRSCVRNHNTERRGRRSLLSQHLAQFISEASSCLLCGKGSFVVEIPDLIFLPLLWFCSHKTQNEDLPNAGLRDEHSASRDHLLLCERMPCWLWCDGQNRF